MQYELSKPTEATAVRIGDVPEIDPTGPASAAERLGVLLKFHNLTAEDLE